MNFLIDLGNVLFCFDFEKSLSKFLPDGESSVSDWLAPVMHQKDPFEAGKIRSDVFIPWAMERLRARGSEADFRAAWCDIFVKNEPMWNDMLSLKKAGHRLILFSNINDLHWDFIQARWPEIAVFDDLVLSYKVGAIKPEPEIYDYAIRTFQLDPSTLRYVDDLEKNIGGGERLGMRAFQYDVNRHEAFQLWLAGELHDG